MPLLTPKEVKKLCNNNSAAKQYWQTLSDKLNQLPASRHLKFLFDELKYFANSLPTSIDEAESNDPSSYATQITEGLHTLYKMNLICREILRTSASLDGPQGDNQIITVAQRSLEILPNAIQILVNKDKQSVRTAATILAFLIGLTLFTGSLRGGTVGLSCGIAQGVLCLFAFYNIFKNISSGCKSSTADISRLKEIIPVPGLVIDLQERLLQNEELTIDINPEQIQVSAAIEMSRLESQSLNCSICISPSGVDESLFTLVEEEESKNFSFQGPYHPNCINHWNNTKKTDPNTNLKALLSPHGKNILLFKLPLENKSNPIEEQSLQVAGEHNRSDDLKVNLLSHT